MIAVKVRPSEIANARPARVVKAEAPRRYGLDIGDFFLGLAVGTLFIAPWIYVPVARAIVVRGISKALGIAEKKIWEALERRK